VENVTGFLDKQIMQETGAVANIRKSFADQNQKALAKKQATGKSAGQTSMGSNNRTNR